MTDLPRTAEGWLRWVLLGVAFGVPVFFLRSTNDAINVPKLFLLVAGLSVALPLLGFASRNRPLRIEAVKALAIPAAAILLPLLVGWAASPYRGWSWMGAYPRYLGLFPYVATVLLALLVAEVFSGDGEPVARSLLAAAVVVAAYAIVQVLNLDPLSWAARGGIVHEATSTMGNSNFTGGLLAMGIPIALALAVGDRDRWRIAALVVLVVGLLVSRSQAAAVAVVAGCLAGGAVWMGGRARTVGLVAAGVLAALMVAVVGVGTVDREAVPQTVKRRADWWDAALDMSLASPLLGRGPNSFALEHAQYRDLDDVYESGFGVEEDPHSLPLSLTTGAGLFGLIGWLALAGWVVRNGASGEPSLLTAGLFGAAVAYLTQTLVSIDTVALRATFWVVAGALVAARQSVRPIDRSAKRSGKKPPPKKGARAKKSEPKQGMELIAAPVTLLLASLGAWWCIGLLRTDLNFRSAVREAGGGSFQTASRHFEAATARGETTYTVRYGTFLGAAAVGLAEEGRKDEGQPMMDKADRLLREASERAPTMNTALAHARTMAAWARVEPSASARAVDLYEEAEALDPANFLLKGEAGTAALELEDYPAATAFFERAVALIDRASYWGGLALAEARAGDASAARAAVDRALAIDPSDPNALLAAGLLSPDKGS